MPFSMKVQPIDAHAPVSEGVIRPDNPTMPVMIKSRLKRLLFRISVADKVCMGDIQPGLNKDGFAGGGGFEPSSVCLDRMVQNFIEDSIEKQSATASSRSRCNCFNGNGSDSSSDCESDNISGADVCDFLKSLVVCGSVWERKVLAETLIIIGKNHKTCKRKCEMMKMVSDGLIGLGYDASICISKWDKSPSFPAGEYEYVEVITKGGEWLIIEVDFRSEFEIARSTKTYKSILQNLPHVFVGKSDRLSKIITIVSEAARQSLKKKGMHFPPWRKADYVKAKWLSSNHSRICCVMDVPTPPPLPSLPPRTLVDSSIVEKDCNDGNLESLAIMAVEDDEQSVVEDKVSQSGLPSEINGSSPRLEPVFFLSESLGDDGKVVKEKEGFNQLPTSVEMVEEKKVDVKRAPPAVEVVVRNPKKPGTGISDSTGLASIMEEYP